MQYLFLGESARNDGRVFGTVAATESPSLYSAKPIAARQNVFVPLSSYETP